MTAPKPAISQFSPCRLYIGTAKAADMSFLYCPSWPNKKDAHAGSLEIVGLLPRVAIFGPNSGIKIGEPMHESAIPT